MFHAHVKAEGNICVQFHATACGTITSKLKDDTDPEADKEFRAAIDGMESLILSLALAGVDIESEQFGQAVQTTIDAITNEHGD